MPDSPAIVRSGGSAGAERDIHGRTYSERGRLPMNQLVNRAQPAVNQLEHLDAELQTILTSLDSAYAWNYGSVKEGLRDLYEKAKRDQWNGTTQLAWDTDVDPERGIFPDMVNPLSAYAPYQKLNERERNHLRH